MLLYIKKLQRSTRIGQKIKNGKKQMNYLIKIRLKSKKTMYQVFQPSQPFIQLKEKQALFLKQCGICNQDYAQDQLTKLCYCDHQYCKVCLKFFVLYKIKNEFVQIFCPKDQCRSLINKQSDIFTNLQLNYRNRYLRIQENINNLRNPTFRKCPRCSDTQLSEVKGQTNLFCTKCVIKFCSICLNQAHKKFMKCDNAVANLLKRNLQFKKCNNCMFIVEKNEGCNHMTCRCGYQFCYLCGNIWISSGHECPPKREPLRIVIREFKKKEVVRETLNLSKINIQFKIGSGKQLLDQKKVQKNGLIYRLRKYSLSLNSPSQNKQNVRTDVTNSRVIAI